MTEWQTLLLWLVIGHVIADFYLQPMSWVHDRNNRHFKSTKVVWHSLVHGVLGFIALAAWQHNYDFEISSAAFGYATLITISHYIIDIAKSYSSKGVVPFLVDQAAHLLVILCITLNLSNPFSLSEQLLLFITTPTNLIIGLGYLLVLTPASIMIRMLLERWAYMGNEQESLPQAGNLIGQLERVLLLTCILIDSWAAVGFILAAKSVFRFGDLTASKDRKLTEYVMLGTLVSILVTLSVAGLIKSLIS
ncbi:DUF3307 domain-containing protein [Pseudoalteromonas phenolica]|uniref:DUF3307 domain-containing protein n=1 Tax=Pseudoalteromonas phenolica TaxID=161398 RepID=UPI00110B7CE0|nr:DUF3307 domain-containing protein [Pseudoalteromonas phenolica]TMN92806.1 DUF3307 domain-containing protein [Pseudoalteromonas phenolica]